MSNPYASDPMPPTAILVAKRARKKPTAKLPASYGPPLPWMKIAIGATIAFQGILGIAAVFYLARGETQRINDDDLAFRPQAVQQPIAKVAPPFIEVGAPKLLEQGDDPLVLPLGQLPDLNQDEPEVSKYEIQNALWWIGATGIDGIRQDTIQYLPRPFIRDLSSAILKQYPKFWMVGEVFEEDSAQTAFFQGGKTGWDGVDTNLPSVFDFKLWRTSQEVFTGKKPMRALRDVLKYDGLYPNINRITILQNNHDTKRFMSLDSATIEGAMLHTAFILATRGIPQLYYGEELAIKGGDDPFNRADFVGGWREDSVNKFTKTGRTADEQKMFEWTQKWIKLRRESLALKKGKTVDLFYDNDVYVFAREHQLVDWVVWNLIAFNRSETEKEVSFDSIFAKKFLGYQFKLNPLIGSNIKTDWQDNKIKIVLPPKSAIAFSVAP